MTTHDFYANVEAARDGIWNKKIFQPKVAIVLGSGLGPIADYVDHPASIPYPEIVGFPKTAAQGHSGELILGYLSGVPVVLMKGRAHCYEGWSYQQVQFPVFVMHALGTRTLITTNAAGGLNSRYRQGDLMVLDNHIDCLPRSQATEIAPMQFEQPVLRGGDPYDRSLIQRALQIARLQDFVLHQGCYLATLGPTYETRHEYSMFRSWGADAVGMSTVPEVLAAQQLHMNTLGFSVITNVASTDVPVNTTHEEVVETGNAAGRKLIRIVMQILDDLSGEPD
ncbi:MAG: purine-nucleoside phosphorylase [Planctomycetota bacterium]